MMSSLEYNNLTLGILSVHSFRVGHLYLHREQDLSHHLVSMVAQCHKEKNFLAVHIIFVENIHTGLFKRGRQWDQASSSFSATPPSCAFW